MGLDKERPDMDLSRCGLWIDASLVLNHRKPAADSYRRVGVDNALIERFAHDYPWPSWLHCGDDEAAAHTQQERDYLFNLLIQTTHGSKTSLRAGFDTARLILEAGGKVALTSHESLSTLKVIAKLTGLEQASLFPLKHKSFAHDVFETWDRSDLSFTWAVERNLHLNAEQKIVKILADSGALVNVNSTDGLNTVAKNINKGFTL